jgi:hypothetical protein
LHPFDAKADGVIEADNEGVTLAATAAGLVNDFNPFPRVGENDGNEDTNHPRCMAA